jgi:hypothetical protein
MTLSGPLGNDLPSRNEGTRRTPNFAAGRPLAVVDELSSGLAGPGVFGAKTSGAPVGPSLARVVGWGVFAMRVIALMDKLFRVRV